MARKFSLAILLGLTAVLTVSCGGGGGGGGGSSTLPPPPTPPADLFGVWAGTWTGTNTPQGLVTGTWEAELVPSGTTGVVGTATLRGDVDCMDGVLTASVDANNVLTGTFDRSPCFLNDWILTALDLPNRSASGVWAQPAQSGQGTLTGVQVAKPGGPRIHFLNPPAGLPNALVTIVGTNLGAFPSDNAIAFDATSAATLTANNVALTARVPMGASTGPVFLTTAQGLAISPGNFNFDVSFPTPFATATLATGPSPSGVAFSPDGRKAFVAMANQIGYVTRINTANNFLFPDSPRMGAPGHSIVAGPSGRWMYVAQGSNGISVLDAATATKTDVIPVVVSGVVVHAGGGPTPNPHGLAVSPDGRYLFVSDNQDGGAVVVIDIATKSTAASFALGTGWIPLGIALHPDGQRAYFAFADVTATNLDVVTVFDTVTMTPTATNIAVGARPTGVAVTPDGAKVYVSNNVSNSVSVIDTGTNLVTTTVAVGLAPVGLAISPDNTRVYVANSESHSVSVIGVASDAILGSPISVPTATSIAISPDGSRAYVTNSNTVTITQLGGAVTLTIAKTGNGLGTVTSVPSGILCGASCKARFTANTLVTLSAVAGSNSVFSRWGGDADCVDGSVTMSAVRSCTVTFTATVAPGGGGSSGGGGGGDCFIATAAYGSFMAEDVVTLRRFRDNRLMNSRAGREYVRLYYVYSPAIADYLREHHAMRAATRMGLWTTVFVITHPRPATTVILSLAFLIVWTTKHRLPERNKP